MSENALDRLRRIQEPSDQREYTLEEQINSADSDDTVSTDEFLDGMSYAAKQEMNGLVQEVTLDDEPTDNTSSEELFKNNTDEKKRRGRRKKEDKVEESRSSDVNTFESNPIYNQIVRDLIDELRKKNYKINRFDDKSMKLIFDYMYSKF